MKHLTEAQIKGIMDILDGTRVVIVILTSSPEGQFRRPPFHPQVWRTWNAQSAYHGQTQR
jgi:hypothetical protein